MTPICHLHEHPDIVLPHWPEPLKMYSLAANLCTQCGRPIGEHMIGGPGPTCPVQRPALWAWE
jgi:hypothetical protein